MPNRLRTSSGSPDIRANGAFAGIPLKGLTGEPVSRVKSTEGGVERMAVQPKLLNLSIYIDEHLRDELTLEVLSSRMNLSPFHFHRKFRAYFGESLHQHIKRLRLERSAHALLYQLTPVSAVARASGYKTLSAFSHAFSAHFGVAPTRFREVMLMGRLSGLEAGLRERLGSEWIEHLAPLSIEHRPERAIAFLRAEVKSPGDLAGACVVRDQLQALTRPGGEVILSSVDLFGILTEGTFRVEISRAEDSLDHIPVGQFGSAVLPAGRYAQFDFTGPAKHLVDVLRAIYHFWSPRAGEKTRQVAHHITCSDNLNAPDANWQIYVPLEDPALAGAAGQS